MHNFQWNSESIIIYTLFLPFMSLHVSFLFFIFSSISKPRFLSPFNFNWIEELVFGLSECWMERQWPTKFIIIYSTFEMFLIFILLYFILIQFLFSNLQKYKSQSLISLACLTVHSSQIHKWMLLFIFCFGVFILFSLSCQFFFMK